MTIDQTASGIHRRAGVATQVFGHWDMSYHEGTIADACWRVVCEMLGGREGEGRGEKSKRRGGGAKRGASFSAGDSDMHGHMPRPIRQSWCEREGRRALAAPRAFLTLGWSQSKGASQHAAKDKQQEGWPDGLCLAMVCIEAHDDQRGGGGGGEWVGSK